MAGMRIGIILSPEANEDLKRLSARDRATVKDLMKAHLHHEPTKISKSRIKRLRGVNRPQYGPRIDDYRIFCDVNEKSVEILAIIKKSEAARWLEEVGE